MRRYFWIVAFGVFLIFASGAFADDLHEMRFTDPRSDIWWNGVLNVYVSPYTGYDETQDAKDHTPTALSLYCIDWNTDFSGYPTWDAAIMPLAPPTGDAEAYAAANFLYGAVTTAYDFSLNTSNKIQVAENHSPDPYYRYLEAAYLFGQMQTIGMSDVTKQELSAAAWSLLVNSSHVYQLRDAINSSSNNSTFATAVAQDLADAATAAGTPAAPNYAIGYEWYVVKPVPGDSGDLYPMQEFLMDPPSNDYVSTVPEPASILLLGVVLVGCGRGLARRWS